MGEAQAILQMETRKEVTNQHLILKSSKAQGTMINLPLPLRYRFLESTDIILLENRNIKRISIANNLKSQTIIIK